MGIKLHFEGELTDEIGIVDAIDSGKADPGIVIKPGDTVVAVDPRYYRPAEVETLLGDPSLAKTSLGWEPRTTLDEMIAEMVGCDLDIAQKNRLLLDSGYEVTNSRE